jgi:hypothetical protein
MERWSLLSAKLFCLNYAGVKSYLYCQSIKLVLKRSTAFTHHMLFIINMSTMASCNTTATDSVCPQPVLSPAQLNLQPVNGLSA